jgi:hypothetical protein
VVAYVVATKTKYAFTQVSCRDSCAWKQQKMPFAFPGKKIYASPQLFILVFSSRAEQGCQIFLDTIYHNRENYTKLPLNYPNCRNTFQMAMKFSNLFYFKALQNFGLV